MRFVLIGVILAGILIGCGGSSTSGPDGSSFVTILENGTGSVPHSIHEGKVAGSISYVMEGCTGGSTAQGCQGFSRAVAWGADGHLIFDLGDKPARNDEGVALLSNRLYGNGNKGAGYWDVSTTAWTSLQPEGSGTTKLLAAVETEQVGLSYVGDTGHASLWRGTAGSFVDLHPNRYRASGLYATDGEHQAGVVQGAGNVHASVWTGTAASQIDLHPEGALYSMATGVSGENISGFVVDANSRPTAVLWKGPEHQLVQLNPEGAHTSEALADQDEYQVGYMAGPNNHAVLWNGTAESALDLHQYLPHRFSSSIATGLEIVGGSIRIVGIANGGEGENAIIWTLPLNAMTSQKRNTLSHPLPVP